MGASSKTNARPQRPEKLMILTGRKLYEKGLICGLEGNLSVRLSDTKILITRASCAKGELTSNDILVIDRVGKVVSGHGKASSEKNLHLLLYKMYPKVRAIIHAHPPYAVACTLAGVSFEDAFLAETHVVLGRIATVPYATPGTPEISLAVECALKKRGATQPSSILLERHGAVALAADLEKAYIFMETLEQTAKIRALAQNLGPLTPLTRMDLDKLDALGHG